MGLPTPDDNLDGYRISDVTSQARRLKNKKLLLVHGTAGMPQAVLNGKSVAWKKSDHQIFLSILFQMTTFTTSRPWCLRELWKRPTFSSSNYLIPTKTMAWWGSGRIFTIHFPTLYLMTALAETKFSKSETKNYAFKLERNILTQQIQNIPYSSANVVFCDQFFFISYNVDSLDKYNSLTKIAVCKNDRCYKGPNVQSGTQPRRHDFDPNSGTVWRHRC